MSANRGFWSSRRITVALVALVTLFAIHLLVQNGREIRADLTEDRIFSLSEGSREILERMRAEGVQPITVTLYFSETAGKSLPEFIKDFFTYQRYLAALLREFEVESEGKIRVRFVDPVPDTDAAQDAQHFGLDGKPINQHGDLFYFGMVFQTQTGSRDVIEFLWPQEQQTVEYEIVKRIHNLLWPSQKRVGVLSSLDVLSGADNPYMAQLLRAQGRDPGESWVAMKLLQETHTVRPIGDVDRIPPEEYDLVVVVHPKSLGERTLWALDEWIVRGGNALVFVDPYALDDRPPRDPQQPWTALQYKASSSLSPLTDVWGVRRVEDLVAADFELGVTRMVSRQGPAERVIVDLQIDAQSAAAALPGDHPVFQGLEDLRFFLPGVLETEGELPEGLTVTPLVTTTPEGNALEIKPGFPSDEGLVFTDMNQPGKLRDRFRPGEEPVVIAYQIQGRFPSAYPEGVEVPAETPARPEGLPPGVELPPPPDAEMVRKEPVPEEERGEATVLLFADVDLISDQVAFQSSPFGPLAVNDNHRVLLNAVDYLFGSEALMKVRAKRSIERPFTLFDEIEQRADEQTREREREVRADLERFQSELQEKQRSLGARNAALMEKQLQDEVELLNERIREANAELYEIRKAKRAALEAEESKVRFAAIWMMPALVLILGLFLFFRRRMRDLKVRRGTA